MTLPQGKFVPYPVITVAGDRLRLFSRYEDREAAKSIQGRQWNPEEKCWEYPLREETMAALVRAFPGAKVDPKVRLGLAEAAEREALVAQAKAQGWEDAEPVDYPFKTKPFAHQMAAMRIVLKIWGFKDV